MIESLKKKTQFLWTLWQHHIEIAHAMMFSLMKLLYLFSVSTYYTLMFFSALYFLIFFRFQFPACCQLSLSTLNLQNYQFPDFLVLSCLILYIAEWFLTMLQSLFPFCTRIILPCIFHRNAACLSCIVWKQSIIYILRHVISWSITKCKRIRKCDRCCKFLKPF